MAIAGMLSFVSAARSPRRARWRAQVLAALIGLLGWHVAAAQTPETLILEVIVNQRSRGVVVEAVPQGDDLLVQHEDLRALDLRAPPNLELVNGSMVALSKLPGVSFTVDRQRQILHITASDGALEAQHVGAVNGDGLPAVSASGTGAVLNYDLLGTHTANGSIVTGIFDGRVYNPFGVLSSSALVQQGLGLHNTSRLDTVFRHADENGMFGWSLGDVITGGLAWSRPFRMGGVHIGSDFTTRPDLVTFPIPDVSGRAAVPSTLDLFINNVRQVTQPIDSGPFDLHTPPLITGADNVSVVVRDSEGRETVRNLDFYVSSALLRPDLTAYSFELGWLRQDYALSSDRYTRPAATATVRQGLYDWLTLEAHGEATDTIGTAGFGAAVSLFGQALLTGSVTGSFGRGGGFQYGIGIERVSGHFSFSASTLRTSGPFADVPSLAGDPVPKSQTRFSVGASLGYLGSLQIAYADLRQALLLPVTSSSFIGIPQVALQGTISDAQIVSASYTRTLTDRVGLFASANEDLSHRGSFSALIGLTIQLGGHTSASSTVSRVNHGWQGDMQASSAAVVPGDIGWQVYASEGQVSRQMAQGNYLTPWAELSVGADRVNGTTNERAGIRGAIALVPQGVFVTNAIPDSFAVVDTQGLAGVGVLQENRPVGKTNSAGLLLLPMLQSYQPNRIAIDPADLPADVDAGSLTQTLRPRDRSGVVAEFKIDRGHTAMMRLVDHDGADLPVGAVATLTRTGKSFPVGFDGQVFLSDLQGPEALDVLTPSGNCAVHFSFVPIAGDIPDLGKVACTP